MEKADKGRLMTTIGKWVNVSSGTAHPGCPVQNPESRKTVVVVAVVVVMNFHYVNYVSKIYMHSFS